MLDTEDTYYFEKEWDEVRLKVKFEGITYYVESYPLDQSECDTIVIRVYRDADYTEECGNGLWTDTGENVISGNDELDFGMNPAETVELEYRIIRKVFKKLKSEGVIL